MKIEADYARNEVTFEDDTGNFMTIPSISHSALINTVSVRYDGSADLTLGNYVHTIPAISSMTMTGDVLTLKKTDNTTISCVIDVSSQLGKVHSFAETFLGLLEVKVNAKMHQLEELESKIDAKLTKLDILSQLENSGSTEIVKLIEQEENTKAKKDSVST